MKRSQWIVVIVNKYHGYFQHTILPSEGTLTFQGKKVIDYDGVYELPHEVINKLEEMGYSFAKHILPTKSHYKRQ